MKYTSFINKITNYQTSTVRALSFPNSCAMQQIPSTFEKLIPDLITILHDKHDQICQENEIIHIFSMQPLTCAITSTWPIRLNRILDIKMAKMHVCYGINYLLLSTNSKTTPQTWHDAKTIVVDFTLGKVMDAKQYYYELFHVGSPGKVLGKLDQVRLAKAWQAIREKHNQRERAA